MQTKKIVNTVLPIIVGVLFVVSVVITLVSGMLKFCLLNKDFYTQQIVDDKYLSDVLNYSIEDIKEECAFYGIPEDKIISCIDPQKIKTLSVEYIEKLYLFFDGKAELPQVYYPLEDFYKTVNEHYVALGDINEEEDRRIAGEFASSVQNNINSMSNLGIITAVFKSSAANIVRRVTYGFWWLVGISAVLFVLYVFLKRQKDIFEWIRSSLALLTVSAVFTFIPIWTLKIFDLPSKLILMDSPLKTLVDALLYKTVNGTFSLLLIISIIIFALLTVFSAICAVKTSKRISETEKPM